MYPKYKNFKEDLNRINNKITEIYYNLQKLKPEDMSPEDRKSAADLKKRIDYLQTYIFDVLRENPDNDYDIEEKKDTAWRYLKQHVGDIRALGVYNLPNLNDASSAEDLEDLYNCLGSDNAKIIYEMNKQLGLLGSDLKLMDDRNEYYEMRDKVDAYLELRRQREEEIKAFTAPIPFDSYGELMEAKNYAAREFSEAKKNYEYYKDGKVVAAALEKYNKKKAEYEEIKSSYLGVISVLSDQKYEMENQLKEAQDNLKREQEALKNYDRTSARYKAKFNELAEKEENLTKEIQTLRATHYQIMEQKNDTLAMLDDVKTEFQGYEKGIAKQGEDSNYVAIRKDFAKLLREGSEIKAMRDELDEKLNSIGYLTMDADKKIRTFKEGKMLSSLNDEILNLYKEKKLKGVSENIEFKDAVIKIYNEMANKYIAALKLDEKQKKEFYDKVDSLGKLREHMKKHNSRISNEIEACTAGTYRNKTLSIDKKHMAEYGKKLKELYSKWFEAEQKKASLEVLQAAIDSNGERFSTCEKELREVQAEAVKQQKLFEGESRPTHIAEYEEAIQTLPKKISDKFSEIQSVHRKFSKAEGDRREASAEYNSVAQRARDSVGRLERAEKAYKVARDYLDKVDHLCETSKTIEREGRRLMPQLDLDNNMRSREDFWRHTRKAIDEDIREFLATANVGKKAGHTNSEEFEQMRSSLYYLSGATAEDRAGINALSPDEFLKRLVIVKSAASEYLRKKGDEKWVLGTTMRKTRLAYAKRLEDFANRKLVEITDMVQKNNELNEKIASANFLEPLHGDNPTTVIREIINKPHIERRKAEEEKKLADQRRKEEQERQKNDPIKANEGPVLG